ncbi:MAG TPA: hypothetical protein PK911_02675 [Candidatus Saccharibacteria bacterium]|nr:hypothetical protein [Candidatus Saccharibacteria bacterium]
MPVLEGLWQCKQCNTGIEIPGLILNCPVCGDARNTLLDPEERPYLPENARVITDADELQLADAGPNWNCGKCGQSNLATTDSCSNCGEARGANDDVNATHKYVSGVAAEGVELSDPSVLETDWTDAVLQQADKLQELADGPVVMPSRTFHLSDLPRRGAELVHRTVEVSQTGVSKLLPLVKRAGVLGVGVVVSIVALTLIYLGFLKTYEVELTVKSLSWERQVEVEEFRTLTQEGWTYPSDARIIDSYEKLHHTDRVIDHYVTKSREVTKQVQVGTTTETYVCGTVTVDNGNGTFDQVDVECQRQVPVYETVTTTEYYEEPVYRDVEVYQTWYVYQIDRWVTDYFEKSSGGDTDPYWPEPKGLDDDQRIGDERRQDYEVALVDDEGGSHDRSVQLKTWTYLDEGETLTGHKTFFGSLRKVDWPTS